MANASFGWVACEVTPDQIKDRKGLRTLFNNNTSSDWDGDYCAELQWGGYSEVKLQDITNADGVINFGNTDAESAGSIVDDGLVPLFEEAFKQGLIDGVIHIRYNDVYIDNHGSSGSTVDVYINKDGRIDDPFNPYRLRGIPLKERIELITTVNTMIADAKRKALLAEEKAATTA